MISDLATIKQAVVKLCSKFDFNYPSVPTLEINAWSEVRKSTQAAGVECIMQMEADWFAQWVWIPTTAVSMNKEQLLEAVWGLCVLHFLFGFCVLCVCFKIKFVTYIDGFLWCNSVSLLFNSKLIICPFLYNVSTKLLTYIPK